MEQKIISSADNYSAFDEWIRENRAEKILFVCGNSIRYQEGFLRHLEEVEKNGVELVYFRDFRPNPLYENVQKGVERFREEHCDAILAAGGGSAMDVAKCIKLYCGLEGNGEDGSFLKQDAVPGNIPFLAMPTTAGSGSEATRYAVIYYQGNKQSVTSEGFIPDTVLLDPNCLKSLPLYQKKAAMMDAFCHALESFWSVNSTKESKGYSAGAIKLILSNLDGYLENTEESRKNMLLAAHIAGKAINITQTTAGHAMCYKITGLFGAAHGHAAALCDRVLFPWMIRNTDKCIDPRGREYLEQTLSEIACAMGCGTAEAAAEKLEKMVSGLGFEIPAATAQQYEELCTSVNPVRLKNHPVALDIPTIDRLYHMILR